MSPSEAVKTATTITQVLEAYGPWAVMVVTIIAAGLIIWYMGRRMNAQITATQQALTEKNIVIDRKDNTILEILENRHDQFMSSMRETIETIAASTKTNERLTDLLEKVSRQYERLETLLSLKDKTKDD